MPGRLRACHPVAVGRRDARGRFGTATPTPPLTRGVRLGLGEPPASAGGWRLAPTTGRLVLLALVTLSAPVQAQSPASAEFFEKKVRPLLVARCLECHGADPKKVRGGLRLTSRAELLKGGESGPAVVPGEPNKSRLLKAVRHTDDDLKMPPKDRLKDSEVADLDAWVKAGATWSDAATTAEKLKAGQLFTDEQRRFWAFQPVKVPPIPTVRDTDW